MVVRYVRIVFYDEYFFLMMKMFSDRIYANGLLNDKLVGMDTNLFANYKIVTK